jgi:rSAM/selenodomain-associated transferase 1
MNALIVVAKQPVPGQTKTRLVPPLSFEQAAALYEGFLRDTLALMRAVPDARRVIAYLPREAHDYFAQLAPGFDLIPQSGEDLGARLDHALTNYLSRGDERVVVMNSDGPTLPIAYVRQAFAVLSDPIDAVLGPSDDGGYYLIGLRQPAPRLLRDVRMSTPRVLADTLHIAREENLRVALLPPWYDVDDHASLERLIAEVRASAADSARHTRAALENMGRLHVDFRDLPLFHACQDSLP